MLLKNKKNSQKVLLPLSIVLRVTSKGGRRWSGLSFLRVETLLGKMVSPLLAGNPKLLDLPSLQLKYIRVVSILHRRLQALLLAAASDGQLFAGVAPLFASL